MNNIRNALCAAGILVLTGIAFLPSLHNGFTSLDDDVLVTDNPVIKNLSAASVKTMFAAPFNGLYHPLVLLSYALEYRFFGLDPRAYHATNLALHAANALLVFWLFLLLTRDRAAALVTALLFAVHPLRVESVAWISERKDVLYAFFFLSSAVAYRAWRENGRGRTYLLSLLLFAASLLSKPMAIMLPAVLLLTDWYTATRRCAVRATLPFWALSLVFALVGVRVHYGYADTAVGPAVHVLGGFVTACNAVVFYLVKLAAPVDLSCYYPYTGASWSGFYPFAAAGVLSAAALGAVIALLSRRFKLFGFGAALFLVMLIPVLQVVPVGQEVPADRYTYLPALGPFFIAAMIFAAVLRTGKAARVTGIALAFVVIGLCAASSARRCAVWKDGVTLWSDVIAKHPRDPKGYRSRGDAYKTAGSIPAAMSDYDRAIALKPDYASAYNNRGNLFSDLREYERAILDYSKAIEIDPSYANARYNRGIAYANRGDYGNALRDYALLLRRDPGNADVYNSRGFVEAKQERYREAIDDFTKAIALEPDLREARMNRAFACFITHDLETAEQDAAWLEQHGVPLDDSFRAALAAERNRQAR